MLVTNHRNLLSQKRIFECGIDLQKVETKSGPKISISFPDTNPQGEIHG